jgi:hypothetical protein
MRRFKRLLILIVPWALFLTGTAVILEPRTAAEWVFAGHWLLIPFLPIYAVLVVLGFRATRPPDETPTTRWLKSAQRRRS